MNDRRTWMGRGIAVALLMVGLVIAFGQQGHTVLSHLGDSLEASGLDAPFNDYRDTGYLAGRDVREGENPYDYKSFLARHPRSHEFDVYGPQWFLVQTPLSLLPFVPAKVVWTATIVFGAFVLAHLSRWLAGCASDLWWDTAIAGLIIGSAVGKNAVFLGQPAALLTCGAVLVLVGGRRRPWVAAVGLAIAMVKPQLGVLLALMVGLGFGWWRTVARGVLVTLAAALLPLVVIVVSTGPADFVRSIVDNLSYTGDLYARLAVTADYERLDAVNTAAKVFEQPATTAWLAAEMLLALGLGVVALRRRHAALGDEGVARDPIAVMVLFGALLVGAFHPLYDGMLVVPALVVVVVRWRGSERPPTPLVAAALLFLAPLVYFPPAQRAVERLGASPGLSQSVDSIALLVAFVLSVAVALRRSPMTAPTGSDAGLAHH